jgi:endonuclease/exonuclease/phosphatase family metal-dependent hydrolase
VGTDNRPDSHQITSIPAILAGDFNVRNYTELDYLSECSFRDAFLVARPIPESESPFAVYPTYGLTLINRQNKFKRRAGPPNRSDYVFVHGVEVKDGVDGAGFLGDEPVCALDIAKDEEGRDERVWASDHLGIWVNLDLSIPVAQLAC